MPEGVERLAGLRPLVSGPRFLLPLSLLCEPELLFNVDLKIRLRDLGDGDADAPRGLVLEDNLFALDALDAAAEVALAAYGPAGLHLRQTPRELLEIPEPVEPAFEARRGDFERVRARDEVLHVEDGADVRGDFGAVLVGDAARLVDEDADDRGARAPGEFDVDEFEAALFGRAPRDLAHARLDGSLAVQTARAPFLKRPSEQKKKWAENPLATQPRSEQEANYTGSARRWQPEKWWAVGRRQ